MTAPSPEALSVEQINELREQNRSMRELLFEVKLDLDTASETLIGLHQMSSSIGREAGEAAYMALRDVRRSRDAIQHTLLLHRIQR